MSQYSYSKQVLVVAGFKASETGLLGSNPVQVFCVSVFSLVLQLFVLARTLIVLNVFVIIQILK